LLIHFAKRKVELLAQDSINAHLQPYLLCINFQPNFHTQKYIVLMIYWWQWSFSHPIHPQASYFKFRSFILFLVEARC